MQTFKWPKGKRANLKVYAANHPQRKPTEEWFATEILRNINNERLGVYYNTWLMVESLIDPNNPNTKFGFHTWVWAIEAVLGAETCCKIGKRVCEEQNFTLGEAKQHFEEYRRQQAHAFGLAEKASWQEIDRARHEYMERHYR
jgi:hypothetical protein